MAFMKPLGLLSAFTSPGFAAYVGLTAFRITRSRAAGHCHIVVTLKTSTAMRDGMLSRI